METVPVCHGKQRADHESKALDIDQSVFLRPSMSKSFISDRKIVFIDVYDGNPLPWDMVEEITHLGELLLLHIKTGVSGDDGVMGANIPLL